MYKHDAQKWDQAIGSDYKSKHSFDLPQFHVTLFSFNPTALQVLLMFWISNHFDLRITE